MRQPGGNCWAVFVSFVIMVVVFLLVYLMLSGEQPSPLLAAFTHAIMEIKTQIII